jgi:hypothetical protein
MLTGFKNILFHMGYYEGTIAGIMARPILYFLIIFSLPGLSGAYEVALHNGSPKKSNGFSASYRYGDIYYLPSLISNSYLNYNPEKQFTDIWIYGQHALRGNISYSFALELSTLSRYMVGTKHSRAEYWISTGRFQESAISVELDSLSIKLGRINFFKDEIRHEVFAQPINGDGISWEYKAKPLTFKHVIETLPSEGSNDTVFRKLYNYHHLSLDFGKLIVGLGELFILTGPTIGLDFKRLNPLLPYSRNSHDSYRDFYDGYEGDSDNAIIKSFARYRHNNIYLAMYFYIDEFQVDKVDRVDKSDALLFNLMLNRYPKTHQLGISSFTLESSLSFSNPNFGDHLGPFTTAASGGFPILQVTPGMLGLVYIKGSILPSLESTLSISFHHEWWKEIGNVPRDQRNNKKILKTLETIRDYRYAVTYQKKITNSGISIQIDSWFDSMRENHGAASLTLIYEPSG